MLCGVSTTIYSIHAAAGTQEVAASSCINLFERDGSKKISLARFAYP
jgi:hypothetical protein